MVVPSLALTIDRIQNTNI